jgi:hypothetical protein
MGAALTGRSACKHCLPACCLLKRGGVGYSINKECSSIHEPEMADRPAAACCLAGELRVVQLSAPACCLYSPGSIGQGKDLGVPWGMGVRVGGRVSVALSLSHGHCQRPGIQVY